MGTFAVGDKQVRGGGGEADPADTSNNGRGYQSPGPKWVPNVKACSTHQADSSLVPLQIHLWTFFSPYRLAVIHNNALQHKIWQAAFPSAQCCSTNQTESSLLPLQIHLWKLALHTGLQSPNKNALQHWQGAIPSAQWCSTNQTESSHVPLQIHLWTFSLHTG